MSSKANWTGKCISWTAPACAPTRTPLEQKSSATAEALGRSRGGFSANIYVRAEGRRRLMTFSLTTGQANELSAAECQAAPIPSGRMGRPRWRPRRVVGDRGYSSPRFWAYPRQRGLRLTLAHRSGQTRRGPLDRAVYRLRNQVERPINRLKQFRRIATRYEKRTTNFAAMLTIAETLH